MSQKLRVTEEKQGPAWEPGVKFCKVHPASTSVMNKVIADITTCDVA
jgi:hypothetical protein